MRKPSVSTIKLYAVLNGPKEAAKFAANHQVNIDVVMKALFNRYSRPKKARK